jgi:flagellar motility protein MotE (MotC chaperone)
MIRSLFVICGIFCTTVLLAEVVGLGCLWFLGMLTPDTVRDVRLALQGQLESALPEQAETPQVDAPSHDEIRQQRLTRVLELDARESELTILKRMTSDTANQLISDRQQFDQLKTNFRTELERLEEKSRSEASEQIRTILLATPPEDAVLRLNGLPTIDAVDLLRGLPEKSIARILQAFQQDAKTAAKGQELFEALYRGEPDRTLIDETLRKVGPPADATRSAANTP